jgi:lipopolysaccharide transport system permease protein
VLVGLGLFLLNCIWIRLLLALACARFRDVVQVSTSTLQVLFYLTPIIWLPDYVAISKQQFILWNPLFHIFEVARRPLLGEPLGRLSLVVASSVAAVGGSAAILAYARFRNSVSYWI